MKRFCFVNYNDYMCHPHFFYANTIEDVYQYMFDNEMIDYDFDSVDKENVSVEEIIEIFKDIENNPHTSFKSEIFEMKLDSCSLIPEQKLRWKKNFEPVVIDYENLAGQTKVDVDFTVKYIRNMELKKNSFEKMKSLMEFEKRLKAVGIRVGVGVGGNGGNGGDGMGGC